MDTSPRTPCPVMPIRRGVRGMAKRDGENADDATGVRPGGGTAELYKRA